MRASKKLTVSAMMTALGTVLLTVGAFLDVVDLSASALSSLICVFVFIEVGAPYAALTWLATSVLSFAFFPAKTLWLMYFIFFGLYPIVKIYIHLLPKFWRIPLKLLYANAVFVILIFIMPRIFGIPLIDTDIKWLYALMYVALNSLFILYDIFIDVMVRFYYRKLRHRFLPFLK